MSAREEGPLLCPDCTHREHVVQACRECSCPWGVADLKTLGERRAERFRERVARAVSAIEEDTVSDHHWSDEEWAAYEQGVIAASKKGDARVAVLAILDDYAELRVVVEGLRTQLATVEKYSKLVESSNRALTAENDRLGAQVAAVKALAEQAEQPPTFGAVAGRGYVRAAAIRAALEGLA